MNGANITCLFALNDDKTIAGVIKIHDCLRAGVV